METFELISQAKVVRATITAAHEDGTVSIDQHDARCDVLQTSDRPPLSLAEGDTVLVWLASDDESCNVVLGRVGQTSRPSTNGREIADELVIEARKNLTLKCGDGSITIREDGKILIKGRDLVSHARRVNRIKGGSVAIN